MDNKYNQETLDAFKEAADIKANPEKYKSYNTAEEMYEDIMREAANDPGFIERCEVISKNFAQIDYLEENFERKREE